MMKHLHGLMIRFQALGRALMLPIAVLPVAALFLRLGQEDMLNVMFMAAAGDAVFANLGLLFAAGVAVGLARENHGAAALAGVVAYLVTTEGAKSLLHVPPGLAQSQVEAAAWRAAEIAKLNVPAGILSGIVAGLLYNRFATIKLPEYLAFFAGRRFVPIAAGTAGLAGAVLFGLGFTWFEAGVDTLSQGVVQAGRAGLFAYGVFNRLLLVTGLHHILNNLAWFVLGDYGGATGDLKRFFAGDPDAGVFMSGFFPVMMFGLPAACLAMYRQALPDQRHKVGGLFLSLALTSFLTGVTEPIEFTFMFLAPVLYLIHALLTGLSMVIMDMLGVKLGFGFSAGLFDYVLNYGLSTRPLLLLPVGAAYGAVYYFTFSWAIRRFDMKTPGRDAQAPAPTDGNQPAGERGADFALALGGTENLASVDACTTRLRLVVRDQQALDEARLKQLGARGILRLPGGGVQIVLGPVADQVAGEIRAALPLAAAAAPIAKQEQADGAAAPDAQALQIAGAIQQALGQENIRAVQARSSRLLVELAQGCVPSPGALEKAGVRALVQGAAPHRWHLIVGPQAEAIAVALAAAES